MIIATRKLGKATGRASQINMTARSGMRRRIKPWQSILSAFKTAWTRALPLIDFGCGDGAQTRCLAQHFRQVLGVDVAPAAIKRAVGLGQPANVSYRVLDALHPAEAQELHDEVGDANIYMRGVLHQLSAEDQPICVDTLDILLGGSGAL